MGYNSGYMVSPLGLTERQILIYQKLYEKCDFNDMTVKYTIDQLSCDIKIVDIPAKTIYKNIQIMIKNGYLEIVKKASKGNAPIYRITKITELKGEPKVNQGRTKGEPKVSNTNILNSKVENQGKAKGEPKVHPIKEKEKDNIKKEKDTGLDKIIDSYTQDKELINTIRDFLKMRKAIKKPMTDRALNIMLKKLSVFSDNTETQIKILENSIENSWQGIFQLKENNMQRSISKSNVTTEGLKLRGWD